MKNHEKEYLDLIEVYQKKELIGLQPVEIDKTTLVQSVKLIHSGQMIYHLQYDVYEALKWPYKFQIMPQEGNLCAESLLQLIHPEVREKVAESKLKAFKLGQKMTEDDLQNHKVEIQCPVEVEKDDYKLILLQYTALQLGPEGFIRNFIVYISPMEVKMSEKPNYCIKLVDLRTDTIVFKVGKCIFPKMRLEVLKGIEKNMTTNEIADKLGNSVETVYRHRRALTGEYGFENIHRGIELAKKMGLIKDNDIND